MTNLFIMFYVAGQFFIAQGDYNSFAACEKDLETVETSLIEEFEITEVSVQNPNKVIIVEVVCVTNV